jgi:hypothetical protein
MPERKPNRWMQALHKQNDNSPQWCVPKKGSDRYDAIMGLIRRPVRSSSPSGRKIRKHRSSSPRHPDGAKVRKHRSNSPRHPMRTTIPIPKRKVAKPNIPINGKNPLVYNKATGLYEKANKPVKEAKNPLVYNKATGLYEKANKQAKPVSAPKPPRAARGPRAARVSRLPKYADIAPDTYWFDDPNVISRANSPPPIIHPDNIDDDNGDDDYIGTFAPPNTRDITDVTDVPDVGRVIPIDLTMPYGNFIDDEREALIDDNTILTVSTQATDEPNTQALISGRRIDYAQRRDLESRFLRGNTREVVDVIDDDIQGPNATKIQSQFRKYLAGKRFAERRDQYYKTKINFDQLRYELDRKRRKRAASVLKAAALRRINQPDVIVGNILDDIVSSAVARGQVNAAAKKYGVTYFNIGAGAAVREVGKVTQSVQHVDKRPSAADLYAERVKNLPVNIGFGGGASQKKR